MGSWDSALGSTGKLQHCADPVAGLRGGYGRIYEKEVKRRKRREGRGKEGKRELGRMGKGRGGACCPRSTSSHVCMHCINSRPG